MSTRKGEKAKGKSRVIVWPFLSALLLLPCYFLLFAFLAHAQTPTPNTSPPEDQMYAVAKQLNCPTCEGRNLADCPTDTCTQWKQEIAAQLKAGKTNDEVLAYFKERFGDQVLQEPPKEGFTLLVWVVPIAAALALVAMAVVVTRRAARSAKPVVVGAKIVPTTAAATDDYETQLEEQVKQVS